MNKTARTALILALILSPLWVGALAQQGQSEANFSGLGLAFLIVMGIPLISVIGITFSVITRDRVNANRLSVIGYAIPAFVVCGFELLGIVTST